jgi:hypothetical protein
MKRKNLYKPKFFHFAPFILFDVPLALIPLIFPLAACALRRLPLAMHLAPCTSFLAPFAY